MKEFFTNVWVVGIIGGVLSGIFVSWITRIIFSKRDNKEYLQKILQANREVVYAIRPTISEGEIPSISIINSLISSNSIRYSIEIKDMYSIEQICDELIKEVMDSSFISSKVKTDYCEHLLSLKTQSQEINRVEIVKNVSKKENAKTALEYRQKLTTFMTLTLGLMATVVTFLLTILRENGVGSIFRSNESQVDIVFPAIFVTLMASLISLMLPIYSRINKIKKNQEEKEKGKKDNS